MNIYWKDCYWDEYEEGYRCRECHVIRKSKVRRICPAKIIFINPCKHLGEVLDSSDNPVTVKNCGCSTAEMNLVVAECKIHGECLPTYRRGDLSEPIKTCLGCKEYEHK